MPLWKTQGDNDSNSDIAVLMQVNLSVDTTNQTTLYANTLPNTFVSGLTIGQWGVDSNEAQANPRITHAGWVLKTEGTGLRAGRVTYETLVAAGSLASDASDDTYFPDYGIFFDHQPQSNTFNIVGNTSFSANGYTRPAGGTVTYYWQKNDAGSWANVANTAGRYFDNTSPVLIANNKTANGNVYRVVVNATGANTAYSQNAYIWYIA